MDGRGEGVDNARLTKEVFDFGKAAQMASDDTGLMRMTLRAVVCIKSLFEAPSVSTPEPRLYTPPLKEDAWEIPESFARAGMANLAKASQPPEPLPSHLEARAALADALEGLEEMFGYVPEYFRNKWGHQDYIDRAKAALARFPEPREPQTEKGGA